MPGGAGRSAVFWSLVGAVTLLFGNGVAFGRAPTLRQLPTAEMILKQAKKEIAAQERAAERAKQDPEMDKILAYEKGRSSIKEVQPLLDIFRDPRQKSKYRQAAAMAIRIRFKKVNPKDARIRLLEKSIGKEVVPLLESTQQEVREWADSILTEFWPSVARRIRYDPTKNDYRLKMTAIRRWRRFLSH